MAARHIGFLTNSAVIGCAMAIGIATAEARETVVPIRDGVRAAATVAPRHGGYAVAQAVPKVINDITPPHLTGKPAKGMVDADAGAGSASSKAPPEPVAAPEPEQSQAATEPAASPASADQQPVQVVVAPVAPLASPAAAIPAQGIVECVAGCAEPQSRGRSPRAARREAAANPGNAATAPAETFAPANNGITCVAGCGSAPATRASGPARTADYEMTKTVPLANTTELRTTASDSTDKVLVRRGANGQRAQSVGR